MGIRLRVAMSPKSSQPEPATLKYRRPAQRSPQARSQSAIIHSPISLVSP